MTQRRSRFAPAITVADGILESRVVLSGTGAHAGAALVAHNAATQTTMAVSAGTLGQPVTFTVTVRASGSAGAPTGTVNIIDHGSVLQTLTLTPSNSTSGNHAFSTATFTLNQPAGGSAYFFGKHVVSAKFSPSGSFTKSSANKAFTVSQPAYAVLDGGVKVATIANGSGPKIQPGQVATVLYTGYLASNGRLFDASMSHGGAPLAFTVGARQMIPGFDQGIAGMQAGETRIITIPPAQAYGRTANGPIPANSTLTFVVALRSIS